MSTKFKVGDKVKCINKFSHNSVIIGKIYTIKEYYPKNSDFCWKLVENTTCMKEEWLELVKEEPKYEPCGRRPSMLIFDEMSQYQFGDWFISENLQEKINKQTIMSKITTFAKNLVLSADEKLLRKYGLHDECGNHTDEAEDLVIAKLVKENESYLIELAKGMEAEETKK